jgi:hypothetical protein
MTKRNSKVSPYQRYNKHPHRYSAQYYAWKAAVKAGARDAEHLSREHAKHCANVVGAMPGYSTREYRSSKEG